MEVMEVDLTSSAVLKARIVKLERDLARHGDRAPDHAQTGVTADEATVEDTAAVMKRLASAGSSIMPVSASGEGGGAATMARWRSAARVVTGGVPAGQVFGQLCR